jgi:hypothetical protein
MNEYKGYKLTDITINSDMSLTGKIHYLSQFKTSIDSFHVEHLISMFHDYVDADIAKQSELTNCQNFANELLELCKKHKVELTTNVRYQFTVNGKSLHWVDKCKSDVRCIRGNTTGEISVHN